SGRIVLPRLEEAYRLASPRFAPPSEQSAALRDVKPLRRRFDIRHEQAGSPRAARVIETAGCLIVLAVQPLEEPVEQAVAVSQQPLQFRPHHLAPPLIRSVDRRT